MINPSGSLFAGLSLSICSRTLPRLIISSWPAFRKSASVLGIIILRIALEKMVCRLGLVRPTAGVKSCKLLIEVSAFSETIIQASN